MKISKKSVKMTAYVVNTLGYLILILTLIALIFIQRPLFDSSIFNNILIIGNIVLIIYSPLRFSRITKLVDSEHVFKCNKEKRSYRYNIISMFLLYLFSCAGFSYLTLTGEYPSMTYFITVSIILALFKTKKVASILNGNSNANTAYTK